MEQLKKLNVPSLKTIARERGIRLRTNSRKAEIIQQILDSGIEFNTQDLDQGMGTIGRPAITRGLRKELDKYGVSYTQRETGNDLKRKLESHLNERRANQVDLNRQLINRVQAEYDYMNITYVPLRDSEFEAKFKVQYSGNYEHLVNDLMISSQNNYQRFEEDDYGPEDPILSARAVIKKIIRQSLFAVYRKPIIIKIWQNVLVENRNTGGYDVATPGLWGSEDGVNRSRLSHINGAEEIIDSAVNEHF